MDCKIVATLLAAYLDGELDRAEARALEAHLDACPSCAAGLAAADDLRRALREAGLRHVAPVALRERIRISAAGALANSASVDSASDVAAFVSAPATPAPTTYVSALTPRRRRALPVWLGIAAACLLSFGGGALMMRHETGAPATADTSAQLERDLFASHWRALAATSPVDVISSDHHTVKPWFAGKIAESPAVQDFAAQGFILVGGRIDYLGDARVAVLVYRHGAHWIDVYALPPGFSSLPEHAQARGYAADAIRLGSQPAVMVTDMDAGERTKLAALLNAIH